MKKILTYTIVLLLFISCKKEEPALKPDLYPDQPVSTPSSSAIATFHQSTAFYQMYVYRYDPIELQWTKRITGHFSSISSTDPSALGFTSSLQDSGVPLFDMVRIYAVETGTSNIKTVKINAEKVLQFFPDFEGAKTGIVKVFTQDITLTRANLSTFKIGISGSGNYDENTKLIDLEVKFDEREIGGTFQLIKYKLSPIALTLN